MVDRNEAGEKYWASRNGLDRDKRADRVVAAMLADVTVRKGMWPDDLDLGTEHEVVAEWRDIVESVLAESLPEEPRAQDSVSVGSVTSMLEEIPAEFSKTTDDRLFDMLTPVAIGVRAASSSIAMLRASAVIEEVERRWRHRSFLTRPMQSVAMILYTLMMNHLKAGDVEMLAISAAERPMHLPTKADEAKESPRHHDYDGVRRAAIDWAKRIVIDQAWAPLREWSDPT